MRNRYADIGALLAARDPFGYVIVVLRDGRLAAATLTFEKKTRRIAGVRYTMRLPDDGAGADAGS